MFQVYIHVFIFIILFCQSTFAMEQLHGLGVIAPAGHVTLAENVLLSRKAIPSLENICTKFLLSRPDEFCVERIGRLPAHIRSLLLLKRAVAKLGRMPLDAQFVASDKWQCKNDIGDINELCVLPNNQGFLSCNFTGSIGVWNMEGSLIDVLKGHEDEVINACITHDGTTAISTGWDGTICFWDMTSGKLVHKERALIDSSASVLCLSTDDTLCCTGDNDGKIIFWDVATHLKRATIEKTFEGEIVSLCISSDNSILVAGGMLNDKHTHVLICAWEIQTGKKLYDLVFKNNHIHGISLLKDGESFVCAICNVGQKQYIYDVRTGAARADYCGAHTGLFEVCASPHSEGSTHPSFASVSFKKEFVTAAQEDYVAYLTLWNEHGAEIATIKTGKDLHKIALTPCSHIVGLTDNYVHVWDEQGVELICAQTRSYPADVKLSLDTTKLIVGCYSGDLNMYDISIFKDFEKVSVQQFSSLWQKLSAQNVTITWSDILEVVRSSCLEEAEPAQKVARVGEQLQDLAIDKHDVGTECIGMELIHSEYL